MKETAEIPDPVHPALPDAAVPIRRDGYHLDKIPCCLVLQNGAGENVLVLNETSALIWRLCNGDVSVGDIIGMICESFTVSRDQIARDVYRALDTFRTYELLDIEGA